MTIGKNPSSGGGAIEFWFDFSSPYGYFAAHEIDGRMARFGRAVTWQPFLLGAVFKLTGLAALANTPLRGDYARRDWDRIAKLLSIPFQLPASHPYPSQSVARSFYWFTEHHPEAAKPFARQALRAHFVEGETLETPEKTIALAAAFTAEADALGRWLGSDAAKDRLRSATERAVSKGVFGSPFFIADGEPFWGWDRIAMLESWLERGAWP